MKLFKKLLPIATIGSVAAIVAPIATSCSANIAEIIDGKTRYIPTVAQAIPKQTLYTEDQAETAYVEDISENEEVLFQDFKASISANAYSQIGAISGDNKPQCQIQVNFSNLTSTKIGENMFLSFTMSGAAKTWGLKFNVTKSKNRRIDSDLSFKFKLVNLPYEITVDNEGYCSVSPEGLGLDNADLRLEMTANGTLCDDEHAPASWISFSNETFIFDGTGKLPSKWETLLLFASYFASADTSYHLATLHVTDEKL